MVTCPKNTAQWLVRSRDEQCPTNTFYHCIKTQLGQLFETCVDFIWVQKNHCPEWNIAGSLDVVSCAGVKDCPTETFKSYEVYRHPVCLRNIEPTTTARPTTTTTTTTTQLPNTTTAMLASSTVSAERSEYEHLWFFVLMVILSCAILVVLFVFIIRYHLRVRRRQKGEPLAAKDPEIPVNDGELTNEPSTKTPLLDGQKEEEKNENGQKDEKENEIVEVNEETGFVKSDAYKEGIDVLEKDDVLIIIGSPGSGKSATASEILSTYKKRNWQCTIIDTLHKADLNLNFAVKQVVLVDNCFGKWNDDPSEKDLLQIKDRLNFLFTDGLQKTGHLKLILSIRKRAYTAHQRYLKSVPGLVQSKTIDLDAENCFSPCQKEYLLDYLFGKSENENGDSDNKSKKLQEEFSEHCKSDGLGFPLKAQLLCRIPDLLVTDFLNDVVGGLKKHFKSMMESREEDDKLNYAALMYVMLKGRISEKCTLDRMCAERLHHLLTEQKLKKLLVALNQYLTRDKENFFVFAHEILYISAFHQFYSDDTETLLEFCNVDAILELVRIGGDAVIVNENLEISMKKNHFHTLVERIVKSRLELQFDGHQMNDSKMFKDMIELKTKLEECKDEFKKRTEEETFWVIGKSDHKNEIQKLKTKYEKLKAMNEKSK